MPETLKETLEDNKYKTSNQYIIQTADTQKQLQFNKITENELQQLLEKLPNCVNLEDIAILESEIDTKQLSQIISKIKESGNISSLLFDDCNIEDITPLLQYLENPTRYIKFSIHSCNIHKGEKDLKQANKSRNNSCYKPSQSFILASHSSSYDADVSESNSLL